ncbi:MAG: CRTAC1 family protein [Phycisphaerales bacterium]
MGASRTFRVVVAASASGTLVLPTANAQTLLFAERAAPLGVTSTHAPGSPFGLEFQNAGGAVGDFNNDGHPDLFVLGGALGVDKLFINQGDGTFVNQAAAWGIAATHAGSGACVGDYDKDGDLDLFVTSLGVVGNMTGNVNRLYRNNGNGTFTDVAAAAGVKNSTLPGFPLGDAYSPAFGDYDLDGDLDLFVAGYYGGSRLFRNNGNGTFTDVTASAIDPAADISHVRGFSVAFVDINADRYPEILLAADFYTSRLLLNNADGTFSDITAASGCGLDSNGMGAAYADFDHDSRIDWYVTSRINQGQVVGSGNMLYMNIGSGIFLETSMPAGVNNGQWSWGADSRDFNHDGHPDILVTNGWDGEFANDPTHLFLNNDDGTFTDAATACGIVHTIQGRGVATLDADEDGDMDIVIFNNAAPLTYYENQLAGPDAHWIKLRLDTSRRPELAPNGFGASVQITAPSGPQTHALIGGSNYLATSELVIHAGLAADTVVDQIDITWPDGSMTTLRNVTADATYTITARGPCIADLDVSGALDFTDVILFLTGFASGHPQLDLAPPFGVFDFSDVIVFLTSFGQGCP